MINAIIAKSGFTEANWNEEGRRILRAEIVRTGITYTQLAARLRDIGLEETESSVRNKLSRGSFTFSFVLQCCHVLSSKALDVTIHGEPNGLLPPASPGEASKA